MKWIIITLFKSINKLITKMAWPLLLILYILPKLKTYNKDKYLTCNFYNKKRYKISFSKVFFIFIEISIKKDNFPFENYIYLSG